MLRADLDEIRSKTSTPFKVNVIPAPPETVTAGADAVIAQSQEPSVGESVGLVHDVRPAAEIVRGIGREARVSPSVFGRRRVSEPRP